MVTGMAYGVSLAYRKYENVVKKGNYKNQAESQILHALSFAQKATETRSLETSILHSGLVAIIILESCTISNQQFLLGGRVVTDNRIFAAMGDESKGLRIS